ncbi:hypothetical protein Taro_017157 [Colocasia esculenta]|uniref:Uncharacterized protein n=1 Tax=Colocasia esculenta TaxID=4460 RepID=A0A843UYI7_COLES|nr:hypothetical protein [Colocasia esculenta]
MPRMTIKSRSCNAYNLAGNWCPWTSTVTLSRAAAAATAAGAVETVAAATGTAGTTDTAETAKAVAGTVPIAADGVPAAVEGTGTTATTECTALAAAAAGLVPSGNPYGSGLVNHKCNRLPHACSARLPARPTALQTSTDASAIGSIHPRE